MQVAAGAQVGMRLMLESAPMPLPAAQAYMCHMIMQPSEGCTDTPEAGHVGCFGRARQQV